MPYIDYLKKQYDYLSQINGNFIFKGDHISEVDTVVLDGRPLLDNEKKKIHTNLRPQQIAGDIENGKIFLCVLNPGFGESDYEDEEKIKEELLNQLRQYNPSMFWLKNDDAIRSTGGGNWWRNKFNQRNPAFSMVKNIQEKYNKNNICFSEDNIFSMLSRIIVDLELIPYHSKNKPHNQTLRGLPSINEMRKFVHSELIPHAKEKGQIICFLRSINEWNVTREEKNMKETVFCNPSNNCRSITFNPQLPLGSFIFNHIKALTNDFSKII